MSPQQKERHMMLDTNTAFLTILLRTMHNLSNAPLESQRKNIIDKIIKIAVTRFYGGSVLAADFDNGWMKPNPSQHQQVPSYRNSRSDS
jgi:hypothetical protein